MLPSTLSSGSLLCSLQLEVASRVVLTDPSVLSEASPQSLSTAGLPPPILAHQIWYLFTEVQPLPGSLPEAQPSMQHTTGIQLLFDEFVIEYFKSHKRFISEHCLSFSDKSLRKIKSENNQPLKNFFKF